MIRRFHVLPPPNVTNSKVYIGNPLGNSTRSVRSQMAYSDRTTTALDTIPLGLVA